MGEDPSLPALHAWGARHYRAAAGQAEALLTQRVAGRGGGVRGLSFLRGLEQFSHHSGRGELRARQPCPTGSPLEAAVLFGDWG